ncbi:MAG: hypothetical protein A2Z37_14125 [Chloroflexi bacterium RBG_19FT_COMBO_62_14]|nr:MAG: hypothetical protein A2Z37_14125 [Chloroflexi bacterium RBG_19FT_COMBO_62_14]
MDNDDRPMGRVLSRREVLALFGTAGAALLVACAPRELVAATAVAEASTATGVEAGVSTATSEAGLTTVMRTPACVVRPELTEGPYFVDEMLNRSDIRSDPSDGSVADGLPLEVVFLVSKVSSEGCTPLAGAAVDVWHCDAQGVYSDVADPGFNTVGKKFLRGYQVTDANGEARFTTIYPGWYRGRTVHIHFKIRGVTEAGAGYEFTSQLFFDDAVSDLVYEQEPYAGKGERAVRNADDGIFRQSGNLLTLDVTETESGYSGTFDIGIQL